MPQIWHCNNCNDDENFMCACPCEGCKAANGLMIKVRNGYKISRKLWNEIGFLDTDRLLAREAIKRNSTKAEMIIQLKEEARHIEKFGITPEFQECHIENEETFDMLIDALLTSDLPPG